METHAIISFIEMLVMLGVLFQASRIHTALDVNRNLPKEKIDALISMNETQTEKLSALEDLLEETLTSLREEEFLG